MNPRTISISIALLVGAVVLSAALVQYRTNVVTSFCDDSVRQTIEVPPLLVTGSEVADSFCAENSWFRAVAKVQGIYPRNGVPLSLAIFGGILLPYSLLCASFAMVLRTTAGRTRLTLVGGFATLGAILLIPIVFAVVSPGLNVFRDEAARTIVAIGIVGLTLSIAALWLLARAQKQRQFSARSTFGSALMLVGTILLIPIAFAAYLTFRFGDHLSAPPGSFSVLGGIGLFSILSIGLGLQLYSRDRAMKTSNS